MDSNLEHFIGQGEGISLEFKRCGDLPGKDTFETICSFANRQGGSILLGVLDDGTIEGIPIDIATRIERNIVNVIHDPKQFSPTPAIEFDRISLSQGVKKSERRVVIRIWVPMGPSVYRYRNIVYDRLADADVRICSDAQLNAMYLRKQNIYTERRIYPYVKDCDMRLDLLPRIREKINARRSDHPWLALNNLELLKAARLYARDLQTGEQGYTLAGIMLLGCDDLIFDTVPAYITDVIVQRNNTDRYDDRIEVKTNLIDSYTQLADFARKWLPDPFVLEGMVRVSARDIIIRELISNTLIHREYTSPFSSQVVIDRVSITTKNPSRSLFTGHITLANLSPAPKNPVIANFFVQIGLAERLGSGTRNIYKYSRLYSGMLPDFEDGDFFCAKVPLPNSFREVNNYSDNTSQNTGEYIEDDGTKSVSPTQSKDSRRRVQEIVYEISYSGDSFTAVEIARNANVSPRTARRYLSDMVADGKLKVIAGGRSTAYQRAE